MGRQGDRPLLGWLIVLAFALCPPQIYARLGFQLDDLARARTAAAQVIGAGDPAGTASLLLMGQATSIWEVSADVPALSKTAIDQAPVIEREVLGGIEDRAPVRSADQNYYEARAYDYLLIQARRAAPLALAKLARKDLTFAHLFEEPQRYRGEVVHVEGRLRMLRRFDAPRLAAKQGVSTLYEGWIFEEAYLGNPYCVIVSEIPDSIQVGERLEHRVSCDAYFFKRYRYQSHGDVVRDAPLLIGHSLIDRPAAAAGAEASWLTADSYVPAFLVILGGTVAVMIGLACWYFRGDRQVRLRLAQAQKNTFVEPPLPPNVQ